MHRYFYLIMALVLLFKTQGQCQVYHAFLNLSAPDRLLYDRFGFNYEIGNNLVVVGAPEGDLFPANKAQVFDAGFVCIYERLSRGDWKTPVKLYAPAPQEVGHFGQSISLNNGKLLVGEPLYNTADSASHKQAGRAWLYQRDQFGHWRNAPVLIPIKQSGNAWFGYAVALTDSNAFVSAPMMTVNHPQLMEGAGGVYVFSLGENGTKETQLLTSPTVTTGQQFGNAIAADKQTLVIAAHRSDIKGAKNLSSSGAVFIYEKSVGGGWIFKQELRVPSPIGQENFGSAISLSGDQLIVGASQDQLDEKSLNRIKNAGAAYFYRKSRITKKWELEQKLTAPSRSEGDLFGFSVSLSADRLAISSPLKSLADQTKGTSENGSIYLYQKNQRGKLELIQTIPAPNKGLNFGSSVKLYNKWLGIGAYRTETDENGKDPKIDAGLAYLMEY